MKNKLTILLVVFLLLVPFRLPISIMFVEFFNWLLGATTHTQLPDSVISTNVIMTKTVYNITLSSLFVYNVEMLSRQKLGRRAGETKDKYGSMSIEPCYWWVIPIGLLLLVFTILDAVNIFSIFFK